MPRIGFPELILVLAIALIIFGPSKLPSIGSAIGKSLSEFKKASREMFSGKDEVDSVQPAIVEAATVKVDESQAQKSNA